MTPRQYNKCVDEYADRVFRFIVKHTRHEANARDVVQNAFEILWRNHTKVDIEKAKAYLFSVARNNMIDGIRKMKRISHVESFPEQSDTFNHYDQTAVQDLLHQGLAQLNETYKSILLLRDYEGYSYKEIATIMNLNEAQVKVNIFRARKKLKTVLMRIEGC
jgi:RNA polymerase sigma factor (sigma-70 family)